jgi:lipopolysaccharide/colanic/teichoic acid biosynthesis glycosyltransferase
MTFIFNLERPDVLGINLSSAVYLVAALSVIVILLLPDFGKMRLILLMVPVLAIYGLMRHLSFFEATPANLPTILIEFMVILTTVFTARVLSSIVTNFEDVVENLVIGSNKTRVQSTAEGEQVINGELFRARRFSRPVGLLLIKLNDVEEMQTTAIKCMDYQVMLQRRYLRARAIQITESYLYATDPIAWHHDDLVVCLPETNHQEAVKFAEELSKLMSLTLNLTVPIGIASFPEDGLVIGDLIKVASNNIYTPKDGDDDDDSDDQGYRVPELPAPVVQPQHSLSVINRNRTVAAIAGAAQSFFTTKSLMHPLTVPVSEQSLKTPYYHPDFWVNQIPYQSANARIVYRKLKRAIDMLLVILSLPFILPVALMIALGILIEDGRPILFVQKRTGYGGQVFNMYKFRSMIPNAEARMQELGVRVNERGETVDENGAKLEDDPRITRIGKILRKTSLDELPQAWNVFRGQMSIVGPRPTSFGLSKYSLLHTQRLSVKPGITGLWQIYDRGDTDFNNRLIWDIKYIEKFSLTLDTQIVIRTFLRVLKQHGAR